MPLIFSAFLSARDLLPLGPKNLSGAMVEVLFSLMRGVKDSFCEIAATINAANLLMSFELFLLIGLSMQK